MLSTLTAYSLLVRVRHTPERSLEARRDNDGTSTLVTSSLFKTHEVENPSYSCRERTCVAAVAHFRTVRIALRRLAAPTLPRNSSWATTRKTTPTPARTQWSTWSQTFAFRCFGNDPPPFGSTTRNPCSQHNQGSKWTGTHRNAVPVHDKKIFSVPVRKKNTFIVPVQTNFYCTYYIFVKFKHFAELCIVKYLINDKRPRRRDALVNLLLIFR